MENKSTLKIYVNKLKTYFSKPENGILVILGVVLSLFTIAPLITILLDTFLVHVGTVEVHIAGKSSGLTLWNYRDLFFGNLSSRNLRQPFINTMYLSVLSTIIALVYGGIVAYLVTRTDMKMKGFISGVFIFTYIMPQWTLAMVWQNLFKSAEVTGGSNGILAALFGIKTPMWIAQGIFPSAMVLGLHYAPFAYILIGGVFKNMDANLEEAATILNTPKYKIFFRVTLPMVLPAIISTILLVFSSSMGSYPVPHYLNYTTLATRFLDIQAQRPGSSSIISVIMIIIGISILTYNHRITNSRKSYTTVTGKSGQISEIKLGKVSKYSIPTILVLLTLFTSIFPIISFGIETFLENPGDYTSFTTKWWTTKTGGGELGMYGNAGMLYNKDIWGAFRGSVRIAVFISLFAGTIGMLVGYAVSKKRRNRYANYVNSISFLPYLLPSLSVGAAYFVFGKYLGISGTYAILILVGTIKYIPFASRSSLSAMMQLSNEIEEAAYIQNIPWHKRMFRIVIPIQKTAILSGFLLPFMSALRELTLFMLLARQQMILTTLLGYYDEMGLYAFSSGINLILIVFILVVNKGVEKLTGASLDKGIGG